jgi:hypothetical protein
MRQDRKVGAKVAWSGSGGEAYGKVAKKVATPTTIKGHKVAASKGNPEFIVETHDGKQAAHKAGALRKA